MPSDLHGTDACSWENMTRDERREYLAAHLGTDDGNERAARLMLDGGRGGMIPDILLSCSLPGPCMYSVYDGQPQPCEDCDGCERFAAHIEEREI